MYDNLEAMPTEDFNKRIGPVFKFGLATGFALVVLGGISLNQSFTNDFLGILVVCAGLGVLLGAFGSTASISIPIQGITLGGVAAIAIALFLVLLAQLDDRYVLVKVDGDLEDATVELIGDDNYFGAYREALKSHDFVVFGRQIKGSKLKLYVTLKDEDGQEKDYPFECIDPGTLRPHLATGKTIEWSVTLPADESAAPSVRDSKGKLIAADIGGCRFSGERPSDDDESASNKGSIFAPMFGLVSAYAQSNPAPTSPEIQTQIERLESDTSRVRRDARSQLAAGGTTAVKPLLQQLSEESPSYRLRLGSIVALTEMLRENKEHRDELIELIDEEDLGRLVDAAGDPDRTIRVYASEFLYELGDPRSIPLAFDRIPSASVNGRYNVLLGVKGAVPFASDEEQAEVIEKATALKSTQTPETNELIDSIVGLAERN
ncbi:MAG TPA: hypothetical protein VMW68_06665 [Methyloceanibacter sp.]|nr:hypothetical protein [Methyloceanibacter sp.]